MNSVNQMQRGSKVSFFKLLLRHPFRPSPKPISPFLSRPLTCLRTPTSNFAAFTNPFPQNLETRRTQAKDSVDDSAPGLDVNREVDIINLKFAEAREEIEMAMESKETVYFDEEAECARAAVKEVLDLFAGLLGKLRESEKGALQRSMGLKIEQLKAELQQLDD